MVLEVERQGYGSQVLLVHIEKPPHVHFHVKLKLRPIYYSRQRNSNIFYDLAPSLKRGQVEVILSYLIEIVLVVDFKDQSEAKITNYIIDHPISDKEIENKIETPRIEEIVSITNQKPR